MAGTDSRFDASAFRDAIRFAMNMGLPDATEQQATFKWNVERTFDNPQADASGDPWTWTQTAETTSDFEDVQIPVAVEYAAAGVSNGGAVTRLGDIDASKATLTVLDADFESLTQDGTFANQVQLGSALFDIQFVSPPIGLFEVTIYTIHCRAVDE